MGRVNGLPIVEKCAVSPEALNAVLPPSEVRDLALACTPPVDAEAIDEDTLTETYARFEALLARVTTEISAWLGPPDVAFEEVRKFWREMLYASAWRRDDALVVVAVEHPDLGEPVTLSLRAFTRDDVEAISD